MIRFDNWTIQADGDILARQFDNLTRTLTVAGDIPTGWDWAVLVQVGNAMDIIPLTATEGALSAVLTAQQLSVGDKYYRMQLRGTQGDLVKHTNLISVYVAESLSGDEQWPTVPSEFTDLERRVIAKAKEAEGYTSHPPIIGENGNWWEWDGEAYADTGKPGRGEQGVQGEKGEPGYTPQKGVDYWTEGDRNEIAALAATPDQYILVESITTTEEVKEIRRTVEPDGTSYAFKRLMINVHCPPGTSGSMYVMDGAGHAIAYVSNIVSTSDRYARITVDVSRGYLESSFTNANGRNSPLTLASASASMFKAVSVLAELRFTGLTFPVGTKIDIYGVRVNPAGSIDALADEILAAQENYIGGGA